MASPPKTWLITAGRRSQPAPLFGFALFSIFSEEIVAPPAFDSSRILAPDFITPYSSLGSVVGVEVTPSVYMDVTSNELVFKDAANFGRYTISAPGAASAIPEEFLANIDFSFGDSTAFPYFAMSMTVGNTSNSLGVAFSTQADVIGGVGTNELIIFFDGITLASASFTPPRIGSLSLELKNGQITASVNGSPIISVSDSFPAIDPSPLSYFFSYWPFSYLQIGARGSSTSNELHTTPVSGTITGASLFFPSLVGVRLISANQNGEGLPPGPGIGRPDLVFAPMVASAGNIPSQEAFGALDATPAALSGGDMLFHLDGSLNSIGSIDATYGGTLETSPTKFGSGSMSGFASLSSPTTFPAIDGDFNLDFWMYVPTGADSSSVSFGEWYELYLFSNLGDSFGDFEPGLTISTAAVMFWTFETNSAVIGPAGVLNMDSFNHVEVSRTGTTWRLFLNGVLLGTSTYLAADLPGSGVTISMATGAFVDEIRVLYGAGGHTSNFTPPTAPY